MRLATTVLMAVAIAATGCLNTLTFATTTQLGIDINATENGQQHAVIGYKRAEGAIMPVKKDRNSPPRKEAFSVMAASNFESGAVLLAALTTTKVKSVFATGEAAKKGGVKAIAKPYHATYGEIMSPEADWLNLELRSTVENAPEARKAAVRSAIWSAIVGSEQVESRWLLIYGVQREGDKGVLLKALQAARKEAGVDGDLEDAQKEDPTSFLIQQIIESADQPNRDAVYDAVAAELEGADQVSTLTPEQLVEELVDLAALDDRTAEMRTALTAALAAARG